VTGTVRDATGTVAGATCRALAKGADEYGPDAVAPGAETDEQGTFTIWPTPTGEIVIICRDDIAGTGRAHVVTSAGGTTAADLTLTGKGPRATIGVTLRRSPAGVVVAGVEPGRAGERAGLVVGDVVVSALMGSAQMRVDPSAIVRMVAVSAPGTPWRLTIARGTAAVSISVVTEAPEPRE
jgi:hypothetical protein